MDKTDYDKLTKNIPTEKWCPAPFVHGYINANNRANKLCCMSKIVDRFDGLSDLGKHCLLYTSPSPRDVVPSRMPSSA